MNLISKKETQHIKLNSHILEYIKLKDYFKNIKYVAYLIYKWHKIKNKLYRIQKWTNYLLSDIYVLIK